jgi:hypothetical protein
MWWSLRYLWVVGTHPSYALVVLAAVVSLGIWTVTMNPGDLDSGFGMLLFVQMFLVSSGFVVRARRGHFDPLLIRVRARWRVATAHWMVSMGPGLVAWAVLAGVGAAVGSPAAPSAFVGGRMAALLIVSSVGWAAGFMLPRGAAAVAWLAVLIGLLVERVDLLVSSPTPPAGVLLFLRHVMTLLACPFLLLGSHPPVVFGSELGALCVAAALVLIVLRAARTLDICLVDRP